MVFVGHFLPCWKPRPNRRSTRAGVVISNAHWVEREPNREPEKEGRQMAQTKTKRAGSRNPGGSTRRAGSTTARSRSNSQRSNAKSSSARRSTKKSAPSGSRKKSAGPVSGAVRYLGDVSRQVGSKVTNGHLGGLASKAKGLGSVGAAGVAGLAGLAGGIAFDRWNNSYSRTAALSRSRPGRSMSKAFGGARSGVSKVRRRIGR